MAPRKKSEAPKRRRTIQDPNRPPPATEVPDALRCGRRFGDVQVQIRSLGIRRIAQWRCPYPRLPGLSLCEKHHKYIIDRRIRKKEAAALASRKRQPAQVAEGNGGRQYGSLSRSEATESESESEDTESEPEEPPAIRSLCSDEVPSAVKKQALIDRQHRKKRQVEQENPAEEPLGQPPLPSQVGLKRAARIAALARLKRVAKEPEENPWPVVRQPLPAAPADPQLGAKKAARIAAAGRVRRKAAAADALEKKRAERAGSTGQEEKLEADHEGLCARAGVGVRKLNYKQREGEQGSCSKWRTSWWSGSRSLSPSWYTVPGD